MDEYGLHRGSFGAHVAMVLRRLIRVCLFHGSTSLPQFICCSATMGNPDEHMRKLIPVEVLTELFQEVSGSKRLIAVDSQMDGSPQAGRSVSLLTISLSSTLFFSLLPISFYPLLSLFLLPFALDVLSEWNLL
jgi:hypothetical protein